MRKVAVRVTAIIVALAVAGVGWFMWQSWSRRAGPELVLTLQVDRGSEVTTVQGAPLFFTVFLSGSKTAPRFTIGSSENPWHKHLRLEAINNKKPLPLTWSLLGEPRTVYPRFDTSGNLLTVELYRGGEAVFDQMRNLYTAEFGLAPEETAKLPPGRYSVQAVLEVHSWLPWRRIDRLVSNAVAVTTQKQAYKAGAEELEWSRLEKSAIFYLRAKRFEEAHRLAVQLLRQQPESIDGHILLGDAFNGLRRDQEALDIYRKALLLITIQGERTPEPPEYLYARIHEVQRRLKQ